MHGTPLELEAIERDIPVEELKDEQHEKIEEVLEEMAMDFSIYSDTHSEYNKRQTHDMFTELYCNGYIKEKKQTLPYSKEDGRFLPDRYVEGGCPHCGGLSRGDQCDDCGKLVEPEELTEPYSTISGSEDIEFRETTHLFFDLTKFKEELRDWIKNAEPQPVPDSKFEEVLNAIDDTEPRCITRDIEWGFEIPVNRVNRRIEKEGLEVESLDADTYSNKVLYVWFDAPIGYIGFTRELFQDNDEWKDYWTGDAETYYSIGKDNTIFHAVMWPSMLTGSSTEETDYSLPHYEFIQEYLLAEDTKFSKSRGKGLSTEDALDMYPADYWRFYLARKIPRNHDTTFSWKDFESEINNVLNDTIGNFVNRTLSLTEKWFDNKAPAADLEQRDEEVVDEAERIISEYEKFFEEHKPKEALDKAVELARLGDRYLSEEEPWNNEDRRDETIHVSVRIIRALGVTLYPFTPETSEKIGGMLNTEIHTEEGFNEFVDPLLGGIESGHRLGKREILFEKIEVDEKKDAMEESEEDSFNDNTVSFEDFQDMDIRVGEVVSVEEHPNADKLYKVKIDIGEATLQTCAGLKNHYRPDELDGKKVTILANLEPAELRGEKSECMMLAAEDEEGNVSLLKSEGDIEKGSRIR